MFWTTNMIFLSKNLMIGIRLDQTFSALLAICVRGIHRSPVNSPHKSQWRGVLICSFICAWISVWVNNREADDLRRHEAHYDVTVIDRLAINSTITTGAHLIKIVNFNLSMKSDHIHYKLWDEITYSFPKFNGEAVEVREWVGNFNPHITGCVITYPWLV